MRSYKNPNKKYHLYLIKKLLKNEKRGEFIEIGCGLGFITALLIKMGFKGKGIDITTKSIKKAREFHPQIQNCFEKKDAFKIKGDKKYRLVVMADFLEHVKDDLKALKIANNLLRKNSIFLLTVPAHQKEWSIRDELGGHFRRYEKENLIFELKDAGFRIEKFYSLGFPIFDLVIKIALRTVLKNKIYDKEYLKKPFQKRSLESGHHYSVKKEPFLARFIFNPVFIRPMFWFQNLFLNTDLGQNYIILARKK